MSEIPRECTMAFQSINEKLAVLPTIAKDVTTLKVYIEGNGAIETSVLWRLSRLEAGKKLWKRAIAWAGTVSAGVVMALLVIWFKE